MQIASFEVENYKGFRERQALELAPLTLLYGENSSGKSALVRLLPWIAESMADPRPGPRLDGLVGRDALWDDLAYRRATTPIRLSLRWQAGQQATWKLRPGRLPGSCELASIRLQGPMGTRLDLEDDGDGSWGGRAEGVDGLLPRLGGLEDWTAMGCERRAFHLDVQWLQGVRVGVPRVEKALAAAPAQLRPTGEGVARFLYYWNRATGAQERALGVLNRFFGGLGQELQVEEVAPSYFRVMVAPRGRPAEAVNLLDTGEGLTQVLAPLVALARAVCGLGPRIVCLEQPELHLHTNAQRVLATSIAQAAREGAQVLVETHSEMLLAAVQLELASGRVRPEDVAVYWVERRLDGSSRARRVELDERGRVGSAWPIDAFQDLLRLKNELFRAQRSGP